MRYCISKNLQDGYLSPEDFYHVINQGQRSYLDFLRGEYQKYQIKRPIAVVEFSQNQMVRTSLAPFVYGTILNIQPSGLSGFPYNFEFVDAMWGIYGVYNIRFVQQDRRESYVHSVIDPIVTNPIYLIKHDGFLFDPARPYGENQANMSYIRTPPDILWGYDLDSNGLPVYNESKSQQPLWSDTDMFQVIIRALQMVGVNLQFGMLMQYSNDIKNTGQ